MVGGAEKWVGGVWLVTVVYLYYKYTLPYFITIKTKMKKRPV